MSVSPRALQSVSIASPASPLSCGARRLTNTYPIAVLLARGGAGVRQAGATTSSLRPLGAATAFDVLPVGVAGGSRPAVVAGALPAGAGPGAAGVTPGGSVTSARPSDARQVRSARST